RFEWFPSSASLRRDESLAVGSLHHSLNKMTPRRAGLTKFRSPTARHPYKLPVVGLHYYLL
ncbi:MAG: hypothetical protein IJB64_04365, partial [Akkermansia sp.]|nr:hypothetical protein [Akkermansia sp.]